MNPVIIIQARMNSTRLPGKVLMPLKGKPLLQHVIERCRLTGFPVAVTTTPTSGPICDLCDRIGVPVHVGSERDVLGRYYGAVINFSADPVIRVTGDCPMINVALIQRLVEIYSNGLHFLVSVAAGEGAKGYKRFPDGLDAEVIDMTALSIANRCATDDYDREHVTSYIWRTYPNLVYRLENDTDQGDVKLSIDTAEDFEHIKELL